MRGGETQRHNSGWPLRLHLLDPCWRLNDVPLNDVPLNDDPSRLSFQIATTILIYSVVNVNNVAVVKNVNIVANVNNVKTSNDFKNKVDHVKKS